MHRFRLVASFLATVGLSLPASAQIAVSVFNVPNVAPSPSNPTGDDWQSIQDTLDMAGAGPAIIRFSASQYDIYSTALGSTEKRQPLRVQGGTNIILRGALSGGTTIVLHGFEPSAPPWESSQQPNHAYPRQVFMIDDVNGFQVQRLTFSMEREPYSIGKVISQVRTGTIRSVTLEMEQDYPDLLGGFRIQRIDDFDWTTRRLRGQRMTVALSSADYSVSVTSPGGGAKPQVTVSNTAGAITTNPWFYETLSHDLIGPGGAYDSGLILAHSKYNCHFLQLNHCKNVTLSDVTVSDMPGMGLIAYNCQNVTMDDFDLQPHLGRLLSISADGVHLSDCTGAVEMTDCDMKGMGDDGLNVQSTFLQVASLTSPTELLLTLDYMVGTPTPHTVMGNYFQMDWVPGGVAEVTEFFAPDLTSRGLATVGDLVPDPTNSRRFKATYLGGYPAGIAALDFVANQDKAPDSVLVENCVVEGNLARGLVLHGHDITVDGCTFRKNIGPAVMLESELQNFFEAQPGDGLWIKNCVIDDSNRTNWNLLGAITVVGINGAMSSCNNPSTGIAPAGVHRNILIQDNQFMNLGNDPGNRKAGIWVTSSDSVHFTGNAFTNVGYSTSGCANNILRLENSTNVTTDGTNSVVGFPMANWFTILNSSLSGPAPSGQNW